MYLCGMSIQKIVYLLLCCSFTYLATAQNFFVNNSTGNLLSININGCSATTVASIGSFTDIATHPDGFMYGVRSNGQMYRINTATGASSFVVALPSSNFYTSLTADASGKLFAASQEGNLFSYNPAGGSIQSYGNMGVGASGDLTYYQSSLYMASTNNTLVKINPTNPGANSVYINFASTGATIYGIVSSVNGCDVQTYATSNDNSARIYRINWANATFTYVCTLPYKIYGGASEYEFNASQDAISIDTVLLGSTTCNATNGSFTIQASSVNGDVRYSINGISYQASGTFSQLPFGNYTVYMQDEGGCTSQTTVTLDAAPQLTIASVSVVNASCGADNGSLTIHATGTNSSISYSIDGGIHFGSDSLFEDLAAGNYMLTVQDANGCTATATATILAAPNAQLLPPLVQHTTCGNSNGQLTINAQDNGNTLEYSINGTTFGSNATFEALAAGTYIFWVRYGGGNCLLSDTAVIAPSVPLVLDTLFTQNTACAVPSGVVSVQASADTSALITYQLGSTSNSTGFFGQLSSGTYELLITTNTGCALGPLGATVSDSCSIYVPTAFSPNDDGHNDVFNLYYPSDNLEVLSCTIYNRWGELVYEASNYSPLDATKGWNGMFRGKKASIGVYVYIFRVSRQGVAWTLSGDVTLLR